MLLIIWFLIHVYNYQLIFFFLKTSVLILINHVYIKKYHSTIYFPTNLRNNQTQCTKNCVIIPSLCSFGIVNSKTIPSERQFVYMLGSILEGGIFGMCFFSKNSFLIYAQCYYAQEKKQIFMHLSDVLFTCPKHL